MNFSNIIVKPVLSDPFMELAYVVHRSDSADCFVVDPGLEPENILAVLQKNALTPVALLITHGHGDHIGGIPALKAAYPDCKIYIGEKDAEKLTDPNANLSAAFGFSLRVDPADITLRDGATLEIAGIRLEVRHVPGHSQGHVIYYIAAEPNGLAFVGDVIFCGGIGRSDFPDGEPAIQIPAIKKQVLSLPDETILYCGHGDSTTVGAEKRSNPFLTHF